MQSHDQLCIEVHDEGARVSSERGTIVREDGFVGRGGSHFTWRQAFHFEDAPKNIVKDRFWNTVLVVRSRVPDDVDVLVRTSSERGKA